MEADELKLQVTVQPWFSILAEELARAGEEAARRGVPLSMVYAGIRSSLSAVVPDAVVVTQKGQGGQNPSAISS